MPAGGSRRPASHETVDAAAALREAGRSDRLQVRGKKNEEIALRILERNGLSGADLDLYCSHQANRRIIEATAARLGLGPIRWSSISSGTATRRRRRFRWLWPTPGAKGT